MLQWDEARYTLGVEGMDATHREFTELAEALARADDLAFPALFQQLVDHTRLHFAEEGRLMRLCKFPPIAIHEAEHARVLGDLIQLNKHIQGGRLSLARAFVGNGLQEWFELHLATMDRALAGYLMRTTQAGVSLAAQTESR